MIEEQMNEMAEAFLRWPLPDDVCADDIACKAGAPHRTGTNLLTAHQALAMIRFVCRPELTAMHADVERLSAELAALRAERDGILAAYKAYMAENRPSRQLYEQHTTELRERAEKAEANYRFMVERAADQRLDGYRELGQRAADAENDRDSLRAELAALRADAERYRWLRDKYTVLLLNGETELRITHGPRANSKSGIDDVIDAARGDTRRGRAPHWGSDDKG